MLDLILFILEMVFFRNGFLLDFISCVVLENEQDGHPIDWMQSEYSNHEWNEREKQCPTANEFGFLRLKTNIIFLSSETILMAS
jgi:hypothetical protein